MKKNVNFIAKSFGWKRSLTAGEWVKSLYFVLSIIAVCVAAESGALAAVLAVANMAIATKVVKTVDVESLMED